ncbi:MAG: BMP family ABC transporter substrate-binding protein [Ardenticatenaceae bacterium]|nr:BMP family ABC transporter substrate-binding protein [Ardenticatenaceae bacterium]
MLAHRIQPFATVVAILICLLVVTACGAATTPQPAATQPAADAAARSSTSAESSQPAAAPDSAPRVGVFVDNAFGDRAFFDIALDGIKLIEKHYAAVTRKYEGRLQPDNFAPILADAAKNNDLVFVLGFEAIDGMIKAAGENPDTTFVFLDAPIDDPNVVSLAYKDQEGCFVAGALAALMTTHTEVKNINADKVVGFVGGVDAPVIQRCLSGYRQGAAFVDPAVKVESIFVGSFVDPAKGKEANLTLIQKGSDINYQYAGLSGEGGFNAAKEGSALYVIGAGFDQRWLAPDQTIGSMLKRVDLSIDSLTGLYIKGGLKKGQKFFWGLAEDGVPFTFSADLVPPDVVQRATEIQDAIKSGKITVEEQ